MANENFIIGFYPFSTEKPQKKEEFTEKEKIKEFWNHVQISGTKNCQNCQSKDKCASSFSFITASGDSVILKNQTYKTIKEDKMCGNCMRKNGVLNIDCINCKRNVEQDDLINRNLLYLLGDVDGEHTTIDEIIANNIEQFHVGILHGEPVIFFDTMFASYKDQMTDEEADRISKIFGVYVYYLREKITKTEGKNLEGTIFEGGNRIKVFDSDHFWANISEIEDFYKNRNEVKNVYGNFAFWGMKLLYLEPMTKDEFSRLTINVGVHPAEDCEGLFCKDIHTGFTFFISVDSNEFRNLNFIITSEIFDGYCSRIRSEKIKKEEEISYYEAENLIMEGKKVRRKVWNNEVYVTANHDIATGENYFIIHYLDEEGNKKISFYTPTIGDKKATDYEIIP